MAGRDQGARQRTRLLALCAMLSALGVVLMYVGSFVEILDFSVALIASFAVILLVIERGGAYPWLIYAVTALLSLLLLPNKLPAVVYAGFMGFYPIAKEKLERISLRWVCFLIKLAVFNLSLLLMWGVALLLVGEVPLGMGAVAFIAIAEVVFVFYDYALSVMITGYLRVWRKKLRVERFFQFK